MIDRISIRNFQEKSQRGGGAGSGHDYVMSLSGGGLITVDYRGAKIAKILIT